MASRRREVTFRGVYSDPGALGLLYRLLEERTPEINISHSRMPTWDEHQQFVASHPYWAWYLILDELHHPVGAIYLTRRNEIGIGVLNEYQGKGYGSAAVAELMTMFPGQRFLANINPQNNRSIRMFARLGFRDLQITLAK